MRRVLAPFYFVGRVMLWIVFFPIGIWRSLVHHRKKAQRRAEEAMVRELDRREAERTAG